MVALFFCEVRESGYQIYLYLIGYKVLINSILNCYTILVPYSAINGLLCRAVYLVD